MLRLMCVPRFLTYTFMLKLIIHIFFLIYRAPNSIQEVPDIG